MSNLTDELADLNVNARELIERIDGFYDRLDSKTQSSLDSIQELLDGGHVATADNALKLEGKSLEKIFSDKYEILQVVSKSFSEQESINSTDYVDTFLTLDITPKKQNSLLVVDLRSETYPGAQVHSWGRVRLLKDEKTVDNHQIGKWSSSDNFQIFTQVDLTSIDVAETTNLITYKMQISTSYGVAHTVGGTEGKISKMKIIEIGVPDAT